MSEEEKMMEKMKDTHHPSPITHHPSPITQHPSPRSPSLTEGPTYHPQAIGGTSWTYKHPGAPLCYLFISNANLRRALGGLESKIKPRPYCAPYTHGLSTASCNIGDAWSYNSYQAYHGDLTLHGVPKWPIAKKNIVGLHIIFQSEYILHAT